MPVYTCKDTGRLYVQFKYKGQPYKRRLPATATKDDGRRLETKLKNQLFFEASGLEGKPEMLWEDFVQDYYLDYVEKNQPKASFDRAVVVIRNSMPFLRGKNVRQVKPVDLERFKAVRMRTPTRHGKPRKPATLHREFKVLSAAFSMAVRNDLCEYNPCGRVKLPRFDNIQDLILKPDDEERFLRGFRNSLQRDIATVVLYTGLRQNDVLGLRIENVDLEADEIKITQGKTKRRVNIPLHPKARSILAERIAASDDGLIFQSYRTGKKLTTIKNGIRFACVRAGIPVLTIRDLRRTYGTRLHENGFDDKTVADLLGHSDTRCVHRYKRGTEIKKKAVLSLGIQASGASMDATADSQPLFEQLQLLAKLLQLQPDKLVEMRGIEPLTSALRTQTPVPIIH